MKEPKPKPLIYSFENPSITAGLAAINATDPPFKVEPKHLTAWFKEGIIARYTLLDDIREMWGKEALRAEFEERFGEAKHCTLIASKRSDREWDTLEDIEMATYSVYALDTAAALYVEEGLTAPSTTHEGTGQDEQSGEREKQYLITPCLNPFCLATKQRKSTQCFTVSQLIPLKSPQLVLQP
ncbi:Xylanase-like protein (modular protein) [Xenorhabdus poinarii G6]|uniref:Xylanase-like protein (Modular protein) n=1 Tax=Xenorhabdus poinarii G6 TaxID=1354304 RepID=A0A068R0E9_9GAMM|nr:hypothetical protein [Xenorhabdus poinarii]CDG20529.1 Xylanase-like protein (modular protein) [Xenorhabdus poinarii G6]